VSGVSNFSRFPRPILFPLAFPSQELRLFFCKQTIRVIEVQWFRSSLVQNPLDYLRKPIGRSAEIYSRFRTGTHSAILSYYMGIACIARMTPDRNIAPRSAS
jgi:hypothetical protein